MTHGQGRATSRWMFARVFIVAIVGSGLVGGRAYGGGFEAPGPGAEAMGRGGAFAAKADDGTALEYNIAGFARQRGTRLLIDGRLVLNSYDFTRAGTYPVQVDAMGNPTGAAWSGMAFPTVHNQNGISGAPVIAVSTDFGYFDRWTFALGLTTPNASDSNRTYPATVNGTWPAPQRYDIQNANLLVVYPMLAAAVRVTKWFDIGLALQLVYGKFDLKATSYVDLGPNLCPGTENPNCDSAFHITASGFTATGVLGLMFHPVRGLHLGLNVRGPVYLNTSGQVNATPPTALPVPIDPASATLNFHLPWVVRLGLRYAFMRGARELGDIEVDGTYEAWKQVEGVGDTLKVPALGPFTDVNATLLHGYKDTGSVRVGGAYNFWLKNDNFITARLGVFYDSSSTPPAYTRLDFDTLDKIGACLGLGVHIRGVTINAAYNFIASPSRTVTDGAQQVINAAPAGPNATSGTTTANNGSPTPVWNNGGYSATTHVIFLGLGFNFNELLKKKPRRDPFEPNNG